GPGASLLPMSRNILIARSERQDIEIVGLSQPVAFALDRPVAFEIPPAPAGSLAMLEVEPRFSSESALRLLRLTQSGTSVPVSDFTGARYVAYSRPPASAAPSAAAVSDLDEDA